MRVVETLREGEHLAVAEDSLWPTTACTPDNVIRLHNMYSDHAGLWLGAAMGCAGYQSSIGTNEQVAVFCDAPAGSKLFSGTAPFWKRVNEMFLKLHKDYNTDCIFQLLSGIGLLHVVQPFVGASGHHWSDRTSSDVDRSQFEGECKAKLRPMKLAAALVD